MISFYFATIIFDFLTKLTHCLFFRRIFPVISAGCVTPAGTNLVDSAESGSDFCRLLGRIIFTGLHTNHRFCMAVRLYKCSVPRFGKIFFHLTPDFFFSLRMLLKDSLLNQALFLRQLRIFNGSNAGRCTSLTEIRILPGDRELYHWGNADRKSRHHQKKPLPRWFHYGWIQFITAQATEWFKILISHYLSLPYKL